MDSAGSFARNLNDARLPSRPGESSSAKPKTTQTATIRQETTRRTATTQDSHSKPEFDFAVPGQTKQRSDDSPHRHSAYSSRLNLKDTRLSSRPGESSSAKPKTTQITTNRQETTRRTATTQESHSKLEFNFAVPGQSKRRSDESPHRHSDYSRESGSPSRKRSRHSGNSSGETTRIFVVQKDSGSWRPIIDLSTLNTFIVSQRFHMETPQSVLRSIRQADWMISLDLQDAYLQVPIHPESRRYIRFTMGGVPYQFRVLCFGLTTAPQVFTRLMAPISAILHRYGIRMLLYLDDWLILAESRDTCIQVRDRLLHLCEELGLQVNHDKSSLVPSQTMTYLGMQILSVRFIAKPTETRVTNLLNIIEEFLSSPNPPAALWRHLLGHLSSLTLLVKGGMLRMRSLQLRLRSKWNFRDDYLRIPWDPLCQEDLRWWSETIQQREGVDLSLPVPDLSFYSDASDVGWGAIIGEQRVSGVWTPCQKQLSINLREMMAVQNGLLKSGQFLRGKTIALFCDNVTTVAYLRRSGGTRSQVLFLKVREILLWIESMKITILPQFIQGALNMRADLLSRPNLVIGSEWTLHQEVVQDLLHRWPAIIDLFTTSLTARLPVFFAPAAEPKATAVDAFLQPWDNLQAYAFPPIAIIKRVLLKLRISHHCDLTLIAPFWPQRGVVSRSSGAPVRHSNRATQTSRSAAATAFPLVSRKSPKASADCVATLQLFARQTGFSRAVADQLALSRRTSTRLNYQARWGKFRKWCKDFHHRSSEPTIPKIAEFLTFLFKTEKAAVSTIRGYRSMLSSVYKSCLPEISTSPILKDLTRSFEISAPRPVHQSPSWDLDKVLEYLSGPPFEPLADASFRNKTREALFLLAMATAKRVGELQALSFSVSHRGDDLVLHYDPFFLAKTESVSNPLPRSVIGQSLEDFVGDLPERVLCPVRAVRHLRRAARSLGFTPNRLFVSPSDPKRSMSKNAMSFFLRQLITESGAVSSSVPPRAHDIRGIATSLNYYSNLSLSAISEAATWKSKRVFAIRYLKDMSATRSRLKDKGPLIAAGSTVHQH